MTDDVIEIIPEPYDERTLGLPTQGPQGPVGPPGPQGDQSTVPGPPGFQGPQGDAGNTVLYGVADPAAKTGVNGNFYINTTTHFMFGPKAGVWPDGISLIGPQGPQGIPGVQGVQGIPGYTVLYGATDPVGTIGVNGNSYINTTTHFIFSRKLGGVWPTGTSLVGPQGPQGIQGIQGPQGSSTGNLVGPASAVLDDIATYDGTTGILIKDSGKKISDQVSKAGDTMTGPLVLSADPSASLGAATKQYTDAKASAVDLSSRVSKAGDTMTGFLTMAADPVNVLGTSTKQYVDGKVGAVDLSALLSKGGDTMTGPLTVNGELVATQNYIRFVTPGGPGYISWDGGSGYYLGGAGTIYHPTNLNPNSYCTNGRLAHIGDWAYVNYGTMQEPWGGTICTGLSSNEGIFRGRQFQLLTTSWWAIGYA